ncbi:hypothetical protein FA15DRAFT_296264 [Coprinopsis marcescibilis]|uniref:Uncharacterized protein n=1 Tax=Coprinopsis marcescibilis TaxID=230819 RepID=A0A5C3KDL4_COPMA|nr:hypothetical protein FA15DRAFT_296264 [Coprinopsis marcescibilis]
MRYTVGPPHSPRYLSCNYLPAPAQQASRFAFPQPRPCVRLAECCWRAFQRTRPSQRHDSSSGMLITPLMAPSSVVEHVPNAPEQEINESANTPRIVTSSPLLVNPHPQPSTPWRLCTSPSRSCCPPTQDWLSLYCTPCSVSLRTFGYPNHAASIAFERARRLGARIVAIAPSPPIFIRPPNLDNSPSRRRLFTFRSGHSNAENNPATHLEATIP